MSPDLVTRAVVMESWISLVQSMMYVHTIATLQQHVYVCVGMCVCVLHAPMYVSVHVCE